MLFLEKIKEMAVAGKLKEKVDIFLITEKIVEFDEIWVVEEGLDFYLPNQLLQSLLILFCRAAEQVTFLYHLESSNEARFFVSG